MAAVALAALGVVAVGGAAVAAPSSTARYGAGGTSASGDCTGTGSATGVAPAARAGRGAGQGAGQGAGSRSRGAGAAVAPVAGATISAAVEKDLQFMVEEEKLARDIYQLAASLYPDRIFTSIAASEARHMSSLRVLLDRYDVADPTAGAASGTFVDDELQALYNDLAAQVRSSRDAALDAGVAIEKADIEDLQHAQALDAPADVDRVLANLMAGSRNHLAAFQRLA